MNSDIDKMINDTNASMEESRKSLQQLSNELSGLVEIVQPALEKQINAIRAARMTTVGEIREALSALREIRKFFLEDSYEVEMARLERFVVACRMIQELKRDGTLDVMAECAIKLGVK